MKRFFALVLCLVMALSLIPAAAAEDVEIVDVEPENELVEIVESEVPAEPEDAAPNSDSGVYFQRANWEYNNHILYLKHQEWASGGIVNYVMFESERPWSEYLLDIQTIVLDEGCVGIDEYAFRDYPHLQTIVIPYSVEYIFRGAFQNCPELQTIDLPGITKIMEYTFEGCSSLRSVTIPSAVTEIKQYAFADSAVQSLEFSTNLTKLHDYALADMSSLSTVTFKGSLPEIGYNCFAGVTATVNTPTGSRAWPVSARKDYGGHLTWANRPAIVSITSVSVTITEPSVGAAPDYCPVLPSGADYYSDDYNTSNYKNDVRWQYTGGDYLTVDSAIFEAGKEYSVFIYLTPKDGYAFAESCAGTINGKTATVHLEGSGQLRVSYNFPALAAKPTITTQPKSQSVAEGTTAKFTVKATDAESYQWYYRKNSSDTWKKSTTTGAKTATLSVTAESYRSGYQYRCKVSNSAGYKYSSAATLTVVTKPAVTTQPKSQSAAEGTTVKFTVAASGGSLKYQWYYRTSSTGEWKKSTGTGATTKTLSVEAKAYRDGYQYRCRVSNAAGYKYSSAATLTVVAKPTITTQPSSRTVSAGTTVKFTVKATGGNLKYQWYYRTSSTGSWQKCTGTGATTATLTVEAKSFRSGYQYRCRVSNAAGYKYSSTVTLTVK